MSDRVKDLKKKYRENVFSVRHPRSIGLFTIPEYPEYESGHGMWSTALDAILTTLRYLAPATLLTLFWGQQSFFFKILKNIDSAFRAIVFSNEEQKQAVLQWIADAGPVRIEHLETVWRHGWILCGVLDAALPGACAGHPPTRMSIKHAQAIADHYLGVEPVFSRNELESNDSLSRHQEWKLATYLDRIRQALAKLTPPVSKPTSQRMSPETTQFTLDYVAKGSGLTAAQVKSKMCFKIYPTAQQSLDPGEITVLIRGPKDTYGMTVFPPILGKAQTIRQKLLGLQTQQTYTENALPITHGAAYFRSYGKNDMNKTYYIPKTNYDIEIEVEMRTDHAKISYTVNLEGRHEISITSRGQGIVGSPFVVTASHNIIGILEKDSFCLEDGEEIDIVDVKTDRKVVLRIVDFVSEKMLLKENGSLEKISDEDAKMLMTTDSENETSIIKCKFSNNYELQQIRLDKQVNKFNNAVQKVIKINRVCKIMNDLIIEKRLQTLENDKISKKQDIPDIVNSTITDITNPFILREKRSKIIVPENISVSIRTEKSKLFYEEDLIYSADTYRANSNVSSDSDNSNTSLYCLSNYETQSTLPEEAVSMDRLTPLSSTNPFVSDITDENLLQDKYISKYVTSEFETDNSQTEGPRNAPIKIIIEPIYTPSLSPSNNNPFTKDDELMTERPKSPIFKTLSKSSYYDDINTAESNSELIPEEMLGNEFINPFFIHHHQQNPQEQLPITDFIIGAPVSLPPIIRVPSPEPHMKPLIMTPQNEQFSAISNTTFNTNDDATNGTSREQIITHDRENNYKHEITATSDNQSMISTFYSTKSNILDTVDNSNILRNKENQSAAYRTEQNLHDANIAPIKEIWDSAYVSIDDSNSTHDANNNDNTTVQEDFKQKSIACGAIIKAKQEELDLLGPAEREIWQHCSELNEHSSQEATKLNKWETKRPTFKPIIEESEKSISSGAKDLPRSDNFSETDTISVAFAELNEIYIEYFPTPENEYTSAPIEDDSTLRTVDIKYTDKINDTGVNSASANLTDVKRHNNKIEGKISEVQSNVSESYSVSQTLPDETDKHTIKYTKRNTDEIKFGDSENSNIVLERKKYWDEKIRQLEDKSQEGIIIPKKKRTISSKQMKHDSLSKRKGKQMIKNFLNAGGYNQSKHIQPLNTTHCESDITNPSLQEITTDQAKADKKIVEKWKKYWDDKLTKEQETNTNKSTATKSHKCINQTKSAENNAIKDEDNMKINTEKIGPHVVTTPTLVKQELPEEVFKAFETSPKRFFGTSRKQILSKIDIFSARSSSSEASSPEIIDRTQDSGLVSSRISLFHTLSNTEELPWSRRKSKSMHNLYLKKDSSKSNIPSSDKFQGRNLTKTDTLKDLERTESGNNNLIITKQKQKEQQPLKDVTLKDKRKRMVELAYKTKVDEDIRSQSFSEPTYPRVLKSKTNENRKILHQKTDINIPSQILRKKSFSKSEMDIFNKVPHQINDDYLDKYKSCDELPRINVKSFISLYEDVTKTAAEVKPVKRICRTGSTDSEKLMQAISNTSDADRNHKAINHRTVEKSSSITSDKYTPVTSPRKIKLNGSSEKMFDNLTKTTTETTHGNITENPNKETTYLSFSDIELEIIEISPEKSSESSPEPVTAAAHEEYKSRFKLVKEYFQSLEELRDVKKPRKLNECELLLQKSNESLESVQPHKRKKKSKSHSMPSSEISKVWNQLQCNNKEEERDVSSPKLVKISEKFNVDDLFTDVMEGRLSRQGSLRGIPNKKAVLETFRSMENIADNKINSYEISESQLHDFAQENSVKNAQSYLTEYPYLPTTDPSKYHSRVDVKASGLISFKELLRKRPRRNSVPDLRLNAKFTEDL